MKTNINCFESKRAVWAQVSGEKFQYVGMKGDKELTLQDGSKVLKLFIWPGGVPSDLRKFEEGLKHLIQGKSNLELVYERK